MDTASTEMKLDMPRDGLEPGYTAYQLRVNFRDMCRLLGLDEAQNIMAEIILDEREGKRND